jgi:hypothetical protein
MTIYLIGLILFFILNMFFIALIHNEKLIAKYKGIANYYSTFNDMPELMCTLMFLINVLWPIALFITFIFSIGYCLFKIFSKLIDHFVK